MSICTEEYCARHLKRFHAGEGCPECSAAPITMAMCGSRCAHDDNGPEVTIANGSSRSCSKCGFLAITDAARG